MGKYLGQETSIKETWMLGCCGGVGQHALGVVINRLRMELVARLGGGGEFPKETTNVGNCTYSRAWLKVNELMIEAKKEAQIVVPFSLI